MKNLILKSTLLCLITAATALAQQPAPAPADKQPAAPPAAARQSEQRPAIGARSGSRSGSQRSRLITGRVVDEANQPIDDALIFMFPAGLLSMTQGPAVAAKLRPTSTDEQGKFTFENVSPGAYTIVASVSGYVDASDINSDTREQKYYHPGDSVTIRMIKGGVITGAVTTQTGEPVVGVRVRAYSMRNLKGRPTEHSSIDAQQDWKTDDRGMYRMYGLAPGTYVVAAGGRGLFALGQTGGYDNDAPTYHPSATRDTAAEVTIHSGEEAGGIDIRYRDHRGHAITGTVSGKPGTGMGQNVAVVFLTEARSNSFSGMALAQLASAANPFSFDAVSDGDYYLTAVGGGNTSSSAPRRVTVKGGDVTGVELALAPFSSIAGRVRLEALAPADRKPGCQDRRPPLEEAVIFVRRDEKVKSKDQPPPITAFSTLPIAHDSTPDEKGDFKLALLNAALYRLEMRLPTEDWYIRSITLPADAPGSPPKDAARNGLPLKAGENIANLTVTIAEGAAQLRGRVVAAQLNSRLPDRLRLLLIPADKDSADDPLRFYEKDLDADSSFSLSNLAPGRYFVMARQYTEEEAGDRNRRPWGWDAEMRKSLRQEAESANITIELQQCQRVTDYVLRFKK
jgi:hypothetical protein